MLACSCTLASELPKKALYVSGEQQVAKYLETHKVGDNEPSIGRPLTEADIVALQKLATTPQAIWVNGHGDLEKLIRAIVDAAAKDQLVVICIYGSPYRDNGGHSAGGEENAAKYREFIGRIAEIIGTHEVIVIVEPDAIGQALDWKDDKKKPKEKTADERRKERFGMIKDAVTILKKQPACHVYLEVAQWVGAKRAADGLKLCGIDAADGFSVNTSGYGLAKDCVKVGTEISALVGNKKFVVETSRGGNGNWEAPGEKDRWCNPPGRKIGETPTLNTGNPLVAAYLWIKPPGESDGKCRDGPAAGVFSPLFAIGLVTGTEIVVKK